MPKGEKTGLGRALVKHHNQMIQQSKEKGKYYRSQQKKVLESVTEISDIEAVIEQADEAHRLFSALNPPGHLPINLDSASSTNEMTPEERRAQQKKEEELHASSLRIPRRPSWNAKMSVEELDDNEKQAFLEWRRSLARLEENENLVLTPFEKNLDIWRQLWRVLERSDLILKSKFRMVKYENNTSEGNESKCEGVAENCQYYSDTQFKNFILVIADSIPIFVGSPFFNLVMVVDARDPLFYRCPDLEAYAREIDEHKRTLLLVNKADLLPFSVREKWAEYFNEHKILYIFWSAKAATAALEGKNLTLSNLQGSQQESSDSDTKVYGRDELLARLQYKAEELVSMRSQSRPDNTGVIIGFVGYPNVGKSSTINALVGEKRTGVTSTPGKTKHFQTLIISEKLTLCDCPGLVFPSFTSSRYEMIASGVLPIDRMTEHREAVQVVANRVPRPVIEDVYHISLPKPKPYEPQSRSPTASEFLRAYCASRGYVASSGLPDETRAARQILKDYIDGKLPHFEMPPGMLTNGISDVHESGSSEDDEARTVSEDERAMGMEHVLNDMNSFDVDNGLASTKNVVKKMSSKPHKQHKKPQRKKDRSWRVGNTEGDGMPVVRVFEKPVSRGPLSA